jgi:hypothetical protein
MIIFKEKQRLDEMATVCKKTDGYGIVVEVYSEDHGVIGDKTRPAYAHLKTPDNTYLGKFTITDQPPRDEMYVFDCDKKKVITPEYKKKVVKWARDKYQKSSITNWFFCKSVWNALHP